MHDSVVLERIEACDSCAAPCYHWIEEGTYEDFKRNILESDLPVAIFASASTGYALVGTYTGRMVSNTPIIQERERMVIDDTMLAGIPLMGTVATWPGALNYAGGGVVAHQNRHWVVQDTARVEETVLAMLLARPEVVNNGR